MSASGKLAALGDAVFNNAQVWLGITVGNNSETTPRSRIVSVGYSYRVGTVDGASGGTISGNVNIVGKGNIGLNNSNSGLYAFVAGYNDTASGDYSTVSGGYDNTASGSRATVGGGISNDATAYTATVGGGYGNGASNTYATVAADCRARLPARYQPLGVDKATWRAPQPRRSAAAIC